MGEGGVSEKMEEVVGRCSSNRPLIEPIGNGQERTIGAQGGAALVLGGGEWSNEGLGGGWGGGSGRGGGWGGRGKGLNNGLRLDVFGRSIDDHDNLETVVGTTARFGGCMGQTEGWEWTKGAPLALTLMNYEQTNFASDGRG